MPANRKGDPIPTLYVLPPSHYCERARWGLDHAGLAFKETGWVAGLHAPLARRIAPGTGLPILRIGRTTIQGSGAILDWAGLPTADPDLEGRLEGRIGALVRQMIYSGTLEEPDCPVKAALFHEVPSWQAWLGGAIWPLTRRAMIAGMKADARRLPDIADRLARELDGLDRKIGSRRYFAGDRFGRADITAASLLAPLSCPAELPLYRAIKMPARLDAILKDWASRPSLVWTNAVYGLHRIPSAGSG